ncbi:MAG: DUF3040 domain-containing protein [Actinomyces sp.]|nr:DUF3040 domain-containing protein [Actinomyces sp.]
MALTEYEKKILEQMEASLREEDPALASQMSAPAAEEEGEPARGPRAPRRIALGLTGAVLGMVVLVAAVSLGYSVLSILLGVAGFALTVAGILYALSRPGASSGSADESSEHGADKSSGWNSFIQDQERRWDDRRGND